MKKQIVVTLIAAVISYVAVWFITNALYERSLITDMNSTVFWIGLVIVIATAVVVALTRNIWPQKSLEYLLKAVPVALLGIGIAFIFLSKIKSLWVDPPWNPSVLGAGVTITALGMTLLTVFWRKPTVADNVTRKAQVSRQANRLTENRTSNIIRELLNQHMILFVASTAFITLLVIFMVLNHFLPAPMSLDVKWVLLSLVPILLALIVGGYIKIFRGFGIEIETRIAEPVGLLDLTATEAHTILPSVEKRDIDSLQRLNRHRRNRVARLTFISSRKRSYDPHIIYEYLNALPNVQYFEILAPDNQFVCLLPVLIFKEGEEFNQDKLYQFTRAVENNTLLDVYRREAITLAFPLNQSIVEVLQLLRRRREVIAVVKDMNGLVVGIIKSTDIEKRIADEVLRAKRLL